MIEFAKKDSPRAHELHLQQHKSNTWILYLNMVIGLWLISDPFTFGYVKPVTTYATIGSGIALIILSAFALHPYRLWAKWGINVVGFGLYLIPMVFFSESGEAFSLLYVLATLIIGLNLLVPNVPGIYLYRSPGPVTPPGWSYNPSSWEERIPVITIAWIGFLIARYMASYQLDYIDNITDPAFGNGTMKVLDSEVSKSFPVSDAALGAVSYVLDVLMGYLGSTARWRTMPWVVIIFAILIIPLGVVSVTLVILQPISVGFWCFFCLMTATISVIMMPFTFDEAAASTEFLIKSKREGQPFWKVFWRGGTLKDWPEESYPDYKYDSILQKTSRHVFSGISSMPWNLLACAALGIWTMFMPTVLDYSKTPLESSDVIVGALVFTFSIATISEVARIGRYFNLLFACWLAASVFFINVEAENYQWIHWVTAIAIFAAAIPRGPVKDRHGMFDKYIR